MKNYIKKHLIVFTAEFFCVQKLILFRENIWRMPWMILFQQNMWLNLFRNLRKRQMRKITMTIWNCNSRSKKKKRPKKPTQTKEVITTTDPIERDYTYTELLRRAFALIQMDQKGILPEQKRHTLPPPHLRPVGSKRTMWTNFAQTCQLLHRSYEHVMSFVLCEFVTEGSLDASFNLLIKGRYDTKKIESILKKYIAEYVTCHTCHKPETTLTRDPVTRLHFLECDSCSSRRSVAPIKTGFHATSRADRRTERAIA